jgi:hypothetical protein
VRRGLRLAPFANKDGSVPLSLLEDNASIPPAFQELQTDRIPLDW